MGRSFAISLAVHAVIFVAAYFGLPQLQDDFPMTEASIAIEIVNVADETNVPSKPEKVEPKPVQKEKPKPKPKPTPPPPPPPPPQAKAPEPEPEPAPVEEVPEIVEPEPKPIEKPKPEPKKVEVTKRTVAPLPPRKPKPKVKAKPVDAFESVLKTLEDLKNAPPPPKEPDPELDFAKMMESALDKPNQRNDLGEKMTISEIDLVRQQIRKCWNLPAGAKDAHKMRISIQIAMNPDGRVRKARILDQGQMSANPFYRAMAESAYRAVMNPRCQPFKLPPEKYDRWKNMMLNFDPKEMFGL